MGPFPLRYATASQEVPIGKFLDDTDGKTAETGLTIANTDIKIWKTGGTTEANKNSGGATHIGAGRYYCVLDATDTDTLGPLEIAIHVSGALPVSRLCAVLPANVYDAMFLGTDKLDVNATEVNGVATTATFDSIAAQISTIDGIVDSILDDTGTAGVVIAAGSKTGYTLAAAGLDSIVVETGVNARQALSPILAAAAGEVSGADTTSVVIKGGNVATTRIAATVDADGNRSAVTLTLPT
jgi:hypothetical protein